MYKLPTVNLCNMWQIAFNAEVTSALSCVMQIMNIRYDSKQMQLIMVGRSTVHDLSEASSPWWNNNELLKETQTNLPQAGYEK